MSKTNIFDIENGVFRRCYECKDDVVIPEGVTSIGDLAFNLCENLVNITLPEGVTSIGNEAFRSCHSLRKINLPESLISIGRRAFYLCSSLTDISLPENIKTIGANAFLESGIIEINISDIMANRPEHFHVQNGELIKYNGPGGNVVIPSNVTSIGSHAFQDCGALKSVVLPEGMKSIDSEAFQGSSLKSITFPDGLRRIGDYAFRRTGLTSIALPYQYCTGKHGN